MSNQKYDDFAKEIINMLIISLLTHTGPQYALSPVIILHESHLWAHVMYELEMNLEISLCTDILKDTRFEWIDRFSN